MVASDQVDGSPPVDGTTTVDGYPPVDEFSGVVTSWGRWYFFSQRPLVGPDRGGGMLGIYALLDGPKTF